MAITAKQRQAAVDALPRNFDAEHGVEAGLPVGCAGVKLRLVTANKKQYWHDHGLRPVRKGSGIVLNDDHMDTTADGTLRFGSLEVWAEHEENAARRRAFLRKKADEQEENIHAKASSRAGIEVEAYGETKIEHETFRPELVDTPTEPAVNGEQDPFTTA